MKWPIVPRPTKPTRSARPVLLIVVTVTPLDSTMARKSYPESGDASLGASEGRELRRGTGHLREAHGRSRRRVDVEWEPRTHDTTPPTFAPRPPYWRRGVFLR